MLPALGFSRLHRFGKLDLGPAECQQLPELCFPPAPGFTLPPDIAQYRTLGPEEAWYRAVLRELQPRVPRPALVLAPFVAKGDGLRVRSAAAAVREWAADGGIAALVVDDWLFAWKGRHVNGT